MDIRPYLEKDQLPLIRLWTDIGLVAPHNNPKRDIERKLAVNPEWFLIGESEGEVIASCMVGYDGHRGWVNYLAVKSELQGKGLGRQMMQAAEEVLKAAGCAKLNLQVRSTNTEVIQFYESIGYTVDSVISMGKRLEVDPPYSQDSINS